jgi:hypothetical protein
MTYAWRHTLVISIKWRHKHWLTLHMSKCNDVEKTTHCSAFAVFRSPVCGGLFETKMERAMTKVVANVDVIKHRHCITGESLTELYLNCGERTLTLLWWMWLNIAVFYRPRDTFTLPKCGVKQKRVCTSSPPDYLSKHVAFYLDGI